MEIKNYGLLLDEPSPEHYVFGSFGNVPMEVLNTSRDWRPYIPKKEYQAEIQETFACVLFTILNCVEILIKKKYGIEKNYSDIFLAKLLETQSNGGTSPQKASELLRKAGVPPEEVWGIEHLFTEIPQEVITEALKFREEYEFLHDFVQPNHTAITSALECSPLLISVPAWFKNENGIYYRPEGMTDNHATTLVYESKGEYRQVFDSYADGEADPSLKELDWNTIPMVVKRFWISRKEDEKKVSCFKTFLEAFWGKKENRLIGLPTRGSDSRVRQSSVKIFDTGI